MAPVVGYHLKACQKLVNHYRSKYGGMEASDVKRLKELQFENEKLKRMYAEMALENRAIKELLGKL